MSRKDENADSSVFATTVVFPATVRSIVRHIIRSEALEITS